MMCFFQLEAQGTYKFPPGIEKIEIPFQSAYNLIVLPIEFNGVELKMILDTGSSKTIIFNLAGIDSLQVQKGNLIKITGYGEEEPFEAYYSENNIINFNGYQNKNSNLIITAGKEIELLPRLGIQINGLLGSDFFQNALVEINYSDQRITLYKNARGLSNSIRRFKKIDLEFKSNKPYVRASLINNNIKEKFLIDTGSSDALMFTNWNSVFNIPEKGFEDYLGLGVNGKLYGWRSKIDQLDISGFKMKRVTASFLETEQSQITTDVSQNEFQGSIGGEILSRFHLIFDFKNHFLYLKPNEEFESGFFYNMAGIDIIAGDTELFTYFIDLRNKDAETLYGKVQGQKTILTSKTYGYQMTPKIMVDYVRPDSPAAIAGIQKGDQILRLNGTSQEKLTVDNTASNFFKNPFSKIRLVVKRGEVKMKFSFRLKPILE